MPFEIVRNDITNMQVDAIVNAASRFPRVNAGVDLAIHKKAGPKLLEARKAVGNITPGSAAITLGFDLDAKYVIHAATPIWENGTHGEAVLLQNAYEECLKLALQANCESIAFPLLASGNHGFPKGKALQIAISAFSSFLLEHEMQIYLVVFNKESFALSEKLVQSVRSFIDERYVEAYAMDMFGGHDEESCRNAYRIRRNKELLEERIEMPCASVPCKETPYISDLDTFLKKKDAGFVETLLSLIKKNGLKNSTVYKRANISKQHFSKLINNPSLVPTKPTAVALALALQMNLEQTNDLLSRAGYTLTNSSIFDLIIQYHIEQKKYNIVEINIVLYEFDQVLLGS